MSDTLDVDRVGKRVVLRSLLLSALTATALVVLYYELPLRGDLSDSAIVLLPLGILAFAYLSWRGVHGILNSPTPRIRAIQLLATVIPLFIVSLAATYYLMDVNTTKAFTQTLSRTDSLYFTVTVFATVGFGDIAPVSESARVVVTLQMLGDLIVIGAGVRVLLSAVRMNVERRKDAPTAESSVQDPGVVEG